MAKQPETHLDLVFLRQVRVRREHISGDSPKEGEPIMRIVKIGERLTVSVACARDMVIHDTAFKFDKARHEALLDSLKTPMKKAA